MTIQFYGSPMSSSGRTQPMPEEAGALYGSRLGARTQAWFEPIKARPACKWVAAQG